MTFKKTLSLLLAIVMLLSLVACTEAPKPTEPTTTPTTAPTTEPTTEPTTAPTEPAPAPAEVYAEAVEKLNAVTDLTLEITSSQTVTINGESYIQSSEQKLSCTGYGTEELKALLQETSDIDSYITTYREVYQNGTAFVTIDDLHRFRGSMTPEEYLSRFVPAVMLDAALYGEISLDGSTLNFTAPTAGESWIVPEYAELVTASGTAVLSDENDLISSAYQATYMIGGIEITLDISMTIDTVSTPSSAQPGAAEYVELEYVDAPRMMEQAAGYLWQANTGHSVTMTTAESTISHAGGIVLNQSTTLNSWGSGQDYKGDVEISMFQMTVQGEDSYEQTEHFENNVYTYSADGSTPEKNPGVTAAVFQNYCAGMLIDNLLPLEVLSCATAEDLGSLYYLELTSTDELPQSFVQLICTMFWGDGDFLDNLATAYETTAMDIYLAIDKYTGFPTALGWYYEGYHTIDGDDYLLSLQLDQSFDLASDGVYKTLTDEPLTPPEPEEKAAPLFYHVTGADGQEMWLLGTIHVGDARTSYLPQEIYDAFDAADALAVEYNSEAFDDEMEENEELSAQVSDSYFYSDGTTTEDHVDAELFEYAEKLMKATGNYHMNAPYMKAYLWSSSIDNFITRQGRSLSANQGVDNQLIWRAEEQGKTILDVESGLFQIQMLTGFSDELQELLLLESVAGDPFTNIAGTQELFEMWCAGDEAALIAYLNEEPDVSELSEEELALLEEYNNAMGTDRNDDMLDVAIGYLESGDVVFYAVGLAHLLAEDGLVNTLRAAGYTVELVTFE